LRDREELLSVELLEEHGRRLAALLSIAPRRRGLGRAHLRQLNEHMRALRDVYTALAQDAQQVPMTSITISRHRSSSGFPRSLPTSSQESRVFTPWRSS
jgi:hypothetical protein